MIFRTPFRPILSYCPVAVNGLGWLSLPGAPSDWQTASGVECCCLGGLLRVANGPPQTSGASFRPMHGSKLLRFFLHGGILPVEFQRKVKAGNRGIFPAFRGLRESVKSSRQPYSPSSQIQSWGVSVRLPQYRPCVWRGCARQHAGYFLPDSPRKPQSAPFHGHRSDKHMTPLQKGGEFSQSR